jgi:membrane-associated phospholipid phosphatase
MHEIEIIVNFWLQGLGTCLKIPMQIFSFLGTQNTYILLLSWIYWCVDSHLGIRIGITLLLSNGLNTTFKWVFHAPRPYWINPNIKALAIESSFGIPSGHAMVSTSVWGRVAIWVNKFWFSVVIMVLLFFIGFSRLYLGVHFLSDVVAGWLFGISLLILLSYVEKPISIWFRKQKMSTIVLFAFLSSISIIILFILLKISFYQWQVPDSWIINSQLAVPGSVIDPFRIKDIVILSGTWFGIITGYFWIKEMGNFDPKGNPFQLVIRFLLGFLGISILVLGLNSILPETENWVAFTLFYFQYFLVSLWIVAIAPMLFIKIGLTNNKT